MHLLSFIYGSVASIARINLIGIFEISSNNIYWQQEMVKNVKVVYQINTRTNLRSSLKKIHSKRLL